jgi:hypothetical protein
MMLTTLSIQNYPQTVENWKITAYDGKCNGFFNKTLEIILTNNTHSYKVVMAEWNMQCVH